LTNNKLRAFISDEPLSEPLWVEDFILNSIVPSKEVVQCVGHYSAKTLVGLLLQAYLSLAICVEVKIIGPLSTVLTFGIVSHSRYG